MRDWEKILVSPETPINDVIVAMGKHGKQLSLIVDEKQHVLGTLADGDIRRSILQKIDYNSPVRLIMNPSPLTASPDASRDEILEMMNNNGIHHIPIVDSNNCILDVELKDDLLGSTQILKPNRVLILAGGLGTRLHPLTHDTPKPLLPLGGRPILETIVRQLDEHGFRNLYVSVNHMADTIKDYFGNGNKFGVNIEYVEEETPLGTAGSLSLIQDEIVDPLIVMNGDLITNLDFSSLITYHEKNRADLTVATREIEVEIPYGVLELTEQNITGITEKPVNKFQVSAGIYILTPNILSLIPHNEYFDMPSLISLSVNNKHTVVGYKIVDYWLDVGRIEDFNRATIEFPEIFG
jgi:dTDP-glucose pyrophosphorylase